MPSTEALAWFGDLLATGLVDVTDDVTALDGQGWWAVVLDFDGGVTCARFADVRQGSPPPRPWPGIPHGSWTSSMSRQGYTEAVSTIREGIARGDHYQVNLCRVLSAPLPDDADVVGLAGVLARHHPAPYAGLVHLPEHGVGVASASPELFLRRSGEVVESGPIKGTAATADGFTAKDRAENVMIVDLVRNDLGRVAATGSVEVPALCAVEAHPGLFHLVSTVRARLRHDAGWVELVAAAFPPGSVTGAPKSSALKAIGELEPTPRGPYCGGIGWVDAGQGTGVLNVGIRTFWVDENPHRLRLGVGAGIVWDSDPEQEWAETELKASRLLATAALSGPGTEEQ